MTTVVWLRHDLRLEDNPALYHAAQQGEAVIVLYVLDPSVPYGGAHKWWLHHSLKSLSDSLKKKYNIHLLLRKGKPQAILEKLHQETKFSRLHWNRLYDPGSTERDTQIKNTFTKKGIVVESFNGSLLCEPWAIKTKQDGIFKVFTPFYRAMTQTMHLEKPLPAPSKWIPFQEKLLSDTLDSWSLLPTHPNWAKDFDPFWQPGEHGSHDRLKTFMAHGLQKYTVQRDMPGTEGTSRLSPHLHWGEISIRSIWHTIQHQCPDFSGTETYLRELGWREFSYYLLFHFPHITHQNFNPKFNGMPWHNSPEDLKAWQHGQTGYPIVDAGMRQLWHTGWMHNRVRMVVASFLTKHLQISWQTGAAWFWDTLVDGDPASNSASWQWVAGSGADAAPYFRIFNPVLQGEKFDPDGKYVRQWVPELGALPDKYIHQPWTAPKDVLQKAGVVLGKDYPEPMIDHTFARTRALDVYKGL
jgi:deoxyribodipyrimidine photo-lyase